MAAMNCIAVFYFLFFNVIYGQLYHHIIGQSFYLSLIGSACISSYRSVPVYFNLTFQPSCRSTEVTAAQLRVRFVVCKLSKHKSICLSISERRYVADLTVCMDVQPNPGWDQKRFLFSQFKFPAQRETNANEAFVNRSFCYVDRLYCHGNKTPTFLPVFASKL